MLSACMWSGTVPEGVQELLPQRPLGSGDHHLGLDAVVARIVRQPRCHL